MNYNKIKVLFLLQRNRTNRQNKCPIRCRVTYNKKRKMFSTGVFVNPDEWDSKEQATKVDTQENVFIDAQLSLISQEINQAFLFLQVNQKEFDVEDIYLQYKGENIKSEKTFLNKYVIFGANSGGKKIRLVMSVGEKIQLKKYDIKFKLFTAEGNIIIPKGINMGRFTDAKDPKKPDAKLKYYSTVGAVTVTKFNEQDNRISGTFQFTAKNSTKDEVKITDGKFSNVKLFSKAPFGDLVED